MRYRLAIYLFLFSQWSFSQSSELDRYFLDFEIYHIDTRELVKNISTDRTKKSELFIAGHLLNLSYQNTISDSYKSVNQDGKIAQGPPLNLITLSGTVGDDNKASLTIGEGFMYGVIYMYGEKYFIEPLSFYDDQADEDEFILYFSTAVNMESNEICGVTQQEDMEETLQPFFSRSSQGLCYNVEYGIVHDYSMVLKYGSPALAEAFAIGVTNAANTNYNDEFSDEVIIQISGQYTIDCLNCEPWTFSSDPNIILGNFSNWASFHLDRNPINISHDVASLWTDKDLDGNVVGVAYLGGACLNTRYNVLQDFVGTPDEKRVLLSHELGHNFNAIHDASGSNFIMAPSITETDQWSQLSVNRIEAFYKDAQCLDICPGVTPQVNFLREEVHLMELGEQAPGPCNSDFLTFQGGVELSHILDDSVVVKVTIDSASTAIEGYDFTFIGDTLTFYNNGPLIKEIMIHVLDDYVHENNDSIILKVSILEGQAEIGNGSNQLIVIHNVADDFSNNCCSHDTPRNYGLAEYQFNGVFYGTQDAKSRTLLRSEDLHSYGFSSGYFDQLSLYVAIKNSSGPYENFRIGIKQVNLVELGQTWYSTNEVYHGDYVTSQGQWNDFPFHTPFYWDGNSDLYIDFCFDNKEGVGRDYIHGWDASNQGYDLFSFRADNYTQGCQLNSGSFFYHQDRNPQLRLRKQKAAEWETSITGTLNTPLKSGEISHFYSQNDKIVATIQNLGKENLGCTDLRVLNAGTGRNFLPNSSHHYSQKNYFMNVENEDAYFEITFYFTLQEMNVWNGQFNELGIIQSDIPFHQIGSGNEVYAVYELIQNQGVQPHYKVITTLRGSGYLAITDKPTSHPDFIIATGNYVISDEQASLVLKSSGNLSFMINPHEGTMVSSPYTGSTAGSSLFNGNLYLMESGSGIYFHSGGNQYDQLGISGDGSIILTENLSLPSSSISLPSNHLLLDSPGKGIIFKSGIEDCWKLVVEESGNPLPIRIKCPD